MKKLYIGNLPYTVDEEEIKEHFSQAGEVESVKIIKDRDSDRSKGFGFVEMIDESGARAAVEQLDGKEFLGRNLKVSEAKPQEKRSNNFNRERF